MELVKFLHFFGLMLGAGAGFGHMATAIAMKKSAGEALATVKIIKPVLGMLGMIGILLLWITGIVLAAPYGILSLGLAFNLKLLAAGAILAINIWILIKIRGHAKEGTPPAPILEKVGKMNGPLSLVAVALAVYVFN